MNERGVELYGGRVSRGLYGDDEEESVSQSGVSGEALGVGTVAR